MNEKEGLKWPGSINNLNEKVSLEELESRHAPTLTGHCPLQQILKLTQNPAKSYY